jgi:hypothetical protein
MNKPLKLIPPAQAEILFDQALREDAYRARSQNRTESTDRSEASLWDDDESDTDRLTPALLTLGNARR